MASRLADQTIESVVAQLVQMSGEKELRKPIIISDEPDKRGVELFSISTHGPDWKGMYAASMAGRKDARYLIEEIQAPLESVGLFKYHKDPKAGALE